MMETKKLLPMWFLAVILVGASSAMAADAPAGWYAGGNLGGSRAKIDTAGINAAAIAAGFTSSATSADESDFGFKVFAGYRFHPNFAVEGGYFNLGKFGTSTVTTPAATVLGEVKSDNGWNLDLVGIAPLNEAFSLFARIGVQTSKTSVAVPLIPISTSETATNWKAGVGAQWDFTKSVGARAEWERYRVPGGCSGCGKGDVDLWSLGLVVRF